MSYAARRIAIASRDSEVRFPRSARGQFGLGKRGLDHESGGGAAASSPTVSAPSLAPLRLVAANDVPERRLDDVLAAMLNVTIALAVLVFVAPLMAAVALAVYAHDGGPVLFAHRRVGRGGRHFHCLKFRTMAVDAEARLKSLLESDPAAREEWRRDHKLRNDPRITPLGHFLRRSSFDELPQLINVLRGEMSLVGPRPIVDDEVARYGRRFDRYCRLKPGITGLWQVSGRNDVTYRRRVAMDCLYARRRSAAFDLAVLMLTVPAVLARRGSY